MDNKDKLNERKKLKMTKFGAESRGILLPKTVLKFLDLKDDEFLYLTSYQAVDGKNKYNKKYLTLEKCELL